MTDLAGQRALLLARAHPAPARRRQLAAGARARGHLRLHARRSWSGSPRSRPAAAGAGGVARAAAGARARASGSGWSTRATAGSASTRRRIWSAPGRSSPPADGRKGNAMVKRGKKTKFIFVTGGVVSSLGKGLAAASIGALLENRGLEVTHLKLDPYINVDPGTMSPFQHGEVFVTDDGAETDLDLGHYERFTSAKMTRKNNFTTGRIYHAVIQQGAARRVPGQDRPGDPAHHRRDQGGDPRGGRRRRRRHRRGRRHGRRHRVAALPRGDPPDAVRRGRARTRSTSTSRWCPTSPPPAS